MPPETGKNAAAAEKTYWLDRKGSIDKVYWLVIGACVLLFLADAFYEKHPEFEIEYVFGFYGLFGFVACVGLVLVARGLRNLLKRREDYYDPRGSDGDDG